MATSELANANGPVTKESQLASLSSPGSSSGIEIRNVVHEYRPAKGRPVLALDGISLEVGSQEFIALLGPSGCGKSTLLYLMGGFLPVQKGEIIINEQPVLEPGPDRGIVFQHFALFPWKTVAQNVSYGLEKQGIPKQERHDKVQRLLSLVGLDAFADSFPAQLSGGMKQRVAIARTLATDPSTLLMDEPFGALDAQTRSEMQDELLSIWSEHPKTVVFVTHDVQEAVYLADRVAIMTAHPGKIKEIVETQFVAEDRTIPNLSKRWSIFGISSSESLTGGTPPNDRNDLALYSNFDHCGLLGGSVSPWPNL